METLYLLERAKVALTHARAKLQKAEVKKKRRAKLFHPKRAPRYNGRRPVCAKSSLGRWGQSHSYLP
jgi:hypothetical protein